MNKHMGRRFLLLNIFVPIIAGALIYYFISPEVIFVKYIDSMLGRGFHITKQGSNILFTFMRNYFLDMLWAYSLVFALYYILGNSTAILPKTFLICFLFSTAMEMSQLTEFVAGTFDCFDIVIELLSEIIAVFIIKIYSLGGKENEEKMENSSSCDVSYDICSNVPWKR